MNPQIPVPVTLMWIAVTLLTLILFLRTIAKGSFENKQKAVKIFTWIIFPWMVIQAAWGFSGFYRQFQELPPKIFLTGIGPALISIAVMLSVKKFRMALLKLDLEALTWFHVLRFPVELGLLFLGYYKTIAPEMTFEGRNFDIISGITAPLAAWLVFRKQTGGKPLLIIWNVICLGLLLNIVITSILAAPFPTQKIAFDQPNIAVFYFPFVWLPTVIVPLVLLAHLTSLIKLFSQKEKVNN